MPNFLRLLVPCLILTLIVSCSTPNESEDNAARAETNASDFVTLDDQFLKVAQESPNFGGMFFAPSGDMRVYMVPPEGELTVQAAEAQESDVKAAIETVFGTELFRQPQATNQRNGLQTKALNAIDVELLQAKYRFTDLAQWYAYLGYAIDTEQINGIAFTDIDEVKNRLSVGVVVGNNTASRRIRQILSARGIPQDALVIEKVPRTQPAATLRDALRPVRAGTQIDVTTGAYGECTLGFSAYSNRFSSWGFVTNSHCTTTQPGMDAVIRGYNLYQSRGSVPSDRIGYELSDPAWIRGYHEWQLNDGLIHRCYAGENCRWSDSAFIKYTTNSFNRGLITRTQSANRTVGTLVINNNAPYFKIVRKKNNFFIGSNVPLNKVGRTTGWTWGYLVRTCADVPMAGNVAQPYRLLCQYQTNGGTQGGDSGSPLFAYYNDGTADLYGLVWGNEGPYRTWFSPLYSVEHELGVLNPF